MRCKKPWPVKLWRLQYGTAHSVPSYSNASLPCRKTHFHASLEMELRRRQGNKKRGKNGGLKKGGAADNGNYFFPPFLSVVFGDSGVFFLDFFDHVFSPITETETPTRKIGHKLRLPLDPPSPSKQVPKYLEAIASPPPPSFPGNFLQRCCFLQKSNVSLSVCVFLFPGKEGRGKLQGAVPSKSYSCTTIQSTPLLQIVRYHQLGGIFPPPSDFPPPCILFLPSPLRWL